MTPIAADGAVPTSFEPSNLAKEPMSYTDTSGTRLSDIAAKLFAGETVSPITVRAFLSWFW